MSLTDLPLELVDCIMANVGSRHTLSKLAQCSRQLYFSVVPHLYQHVTIREGSGHGRRTNRLLANLASLLIQRPDLARLVRRFTLHAARSSWDRDGPSVVSKYSEYSEEPDEFGEHGRSSRIFGDGTTFKDAIKASDVAKKEEYSWMRELSHFDDCHHELILAVLLPALPRMEKLVVDLQINSGSQHAEEMMRAYFDHSANRYDPLGAGLVALLLKHPAIQEIYGYFGNTWSGSHRSLRADKELAQLDSSTSPLIRLDMLACEMSPADFKIMLRVPQALKTLVYKFCPPAHLDFAKIRRALGPRKQCLESLSFDYEDDYDVFLNWYSLPLLRAVDFCGPMPSFIGFSNLKVFKTAAIFLARTLSETWYSNSLIDIFPLSLETLDLTHFQVDFQSILNALEHLLSKKSPQQIPSLTSLILEETEYAPKRPIKLVDLLWEDTQENAMGRLAGVGAAHGVSFDVQEALTHEDAIAVEDFVRLLTIG